MVENTYLYYTFYVFMANPIFSYFFSIFRLYGLSGCFVNYVNLFPQSNSDLGGAMQCKSVLRPTDTLVRIPLKDSNGTK